jgi:hypothetical protein
MSRVPHVSHPGQDRRRPGSHVRKTRPDRRPARPVRH